MASASASASRGNSNAGRIANATATLYSDNQAFMAEIRKSLAFFKAISVDLEKDNQFEKVKELEEAVLELLSTWDDCMHFSMALESIGNSYQPKDELTDFKKLLEDEIVKIKRNSPSVPQNNPFFRQFKEAIWNVHHAGQPMPGEEQEELVMTSTQCNLLNIKCPLSGKPVTQLENPVRSTDCKHIYEKDVVVQYINSKKSTNVQCPAAGCPKMLERRKLLCDPLLLIEIDELRSQSLQTAPSTVVEDFTELED
eukprot:TRINITY_DN7010_c0_g1_i3.p1 TRINITY_DN7010_c0_g1~~TRINITY_DN7010_c0_g1_i3.p1  ORF type:complete len:254 (+),score=56.64 TRINITY_DN7010_c0_g1_i3:316-1077(+)